MTGDLLVCEKCGVPTVVPHTDITQCADAQIAYYAGQASRRIDITPLESMKGDGGVGIDNEIAGGMMQWVPGTLSDMVVERIGMDALADVWNNCGRDTAVFQTKVMSMIYAATGVRMSVYNGPHAENWNGR